MDICVLVLAWLGFTYAVAHGGRAVCYDAFRDMAYGQGILRGRFWEDPTLPGYPAWYPPGSAMLFASLSWLTRVAVSDLYMTSAYWLGWINPVALYLLVRAHWGRGAALLSLPMTLLGSYWWLIHAAMPIPSVQGVAFGLFTLLAWKRARQGGLRWALACGVLGSLAFWHHPVCAGVALGAIAVHGALGPWLASAGEGKPAGAGAARFALTGRAGLVLMVGAALSAPLLVRQLGLARVNAAPHHWFAPELHDPRFALHAASPLIVPLGLLGLFWGLREWRRSGWLVGYFVVALAGEVAGYLGHDLRWTVPWVLPHEFQWHEQLALAVAAVAATFQCADLLAARLRPRHRALVHSAAVLGIVALTLGPALPSLQVADSWLIRIDQRWRNTLATAEWVRNQTPASSVFVCSPDAGYILAGLTGRKCIALPIGHMNPASNPEARLSDLYELVSTRDEMAFLRLARRYGASYVLVDPAMEASSGMERIYSGWSSLERMPVPGDAVPVYRIRPAAEH